MSQPPYKTWTSNNAGGANWTINGNAPEVEASVKTDIGTLLTMLGISAAYGNNTCSVCNQNGEIIIKYQPLTVARYICKTCAAKTIGKLLGVTINPEFEDTLYGGTNEKK